MSKYISKTANSKNHNNIIILKTCPFCGNEAYLCEHTFGEGATSIECRGAECYMSPDVWAGTEEEISDMVKQWNTRVEPKELVGK
jgi:hypothetical protein